MNNFEKFLGKTSLPSTAKDQLPKVLSEKTQVQLLKCADAEEIIKSAIDEINHGSVQTVEALVSKRIKQRS